MGTALRVLMVEDSPDDAALLTRELRRGGYDPHVERVDTAEALTAAIERGRWDLALADFTMPRFSGTRALKLVRQHDADLPFIFVSGTIGEDVAVEAMKAGAQDYIIKGTLKRLLPAIDRELREATERRERRRAEQDLRFVQSVAIEVASAQDVDRALTVSLRMLCEATGCDGGQAWIPTNTGEALQRGPAWYGESPESAALRELTAAASLLPGQNPAGRAWLAHLPVWAANPAQEEPNSPAAAAFALGIDAILAAPVIAGDQVLAVLEFTLRRPERDAQHLVRLVSAAASQLGSVIRRKRAEERLTYLAHYDAVTGLPNRILFNDRLRQALVEAFRHGRLVGVAFLNLDRFKTINDSLGHEVGDRFLTAVAERLRGCMREGDTVAHLSGDEFTLILADMAQEDDAARVARKIVASFDQPFNVEGRELYSSVSLGLALYPFDESNPEALLRNADSAMSRAKRAGGNGYQFFRQEMTSKAAENLALENGLRRALDRGELLLHYQPKATLATGLLNGFEALLRWRQPDLSQPVSPVRFVPVAEEIGLIGPIGDWVLHAACRQAAAWQADGGPAVRMAVNLSPRQLLQPSLAQSVGCVLNESGLPARCLELEITETLLMQHSREVVCALHELKSLGVRLVLDDFGTGYSSLAYLKRFPVDALKIDQSFVQDILYDSENAAIVSAIIAMAHSLGLEVVAEGVETPAQLEFLRDRGCDEAQGYLLGQPLPAAQTAALLTGSGQLITHARQA